MVRVPPGLHSPAQSGRGGPGQQAVKPITRPSIFGYGSKIQGVPLQPGQAQTILQATTVNGTITRGQLSALAAVSSALTLPVVWSTNPTAGSTVLVGVLCSHTPSTVVDNGTSPATFTLDASETAAAAAGSFIYRANGITLPASGSYTVTVNIAAGSPTIVAAGVAYSGVTIGAPTATNNSTGTGSSSVTTGSVTPARPGALAFAVFADSSSANPETISAAGGGFTNQFVETNGASFDAGAIADKITSGGPSLTTCTWTLGDSVNWNACIATYDVTTTSGPGTGQVTLGPVGVGTVWYPAQGTISTTSGVLDTSTFNLYLGPAGVPITLVGTLFPGGTGTIALAIPPMSPGQYLIGIWTGGHAGDLASLNVIGTMDAATT